MANKDQNLVLTWYLCGNYLLRTVYLYLLIMGTWYLPDLGCIMN